MIEEIALENFKAFGEKQTISLAPLTPDLWTEQCRQEFYYSEPFLDEAVTGIRGRWHST